MTQITVKVGELLRQRMVGDVKQNVEKNNNIFLISYKNLSGLQMSDLRKDLKGMGAEMYVTRNTIVKRALKELEQEKLSEKIEGQTALIWTDADSVEVSKLLIKFAKDYEGFLVQGGLSGEEVLEQGDVKRLSDLPSKKQLQAMLLAAIQSPITRFAGLLNAKTRELLSIMKQYSEQKGGN